MKYHKTTKKEFNEFKKELSKWYSRLRLNRWEVIAVHDAIDGPYCACVDASPDSMSARITFNTHIATSAVYDGWVSDTARHEMFHLMLRMLGYISSQRWATEREYDEEEERIVLSLERAIS